MPSAGELICFPDAYGQVVNKASLPPATHVLFVGDFPPTARDDNTFTVQLLLDVVLERLTGDPNINNTVVHFINAIPFYPVSGLKTVDHNKVSTHIRTGARSDFVTLDFCRRRKK